MQNLRWLWFYCRQYGLRWFLCCLSMGISIVCMCMISYLSYVVENALLKQVSLMGTDLLMGYIESDEGINKDFLQYGKLELYSYVGTDVIYKEKESYTIKFVEEDYFALYQMQCLSGRLFYDCLWERCAVVGNELIGIYDLGEKILYNGVWYEVVGVLDVVSESLYGNDNACVFIPYSFYDGEGLQIVMKSYNEVFTKQYLSYYLDMYQCHYEIFSQSQIKEAMQVLLELLEKVLYIIGCVSFVVSMLGIGNVMLLNVEQRKQEIGIRKAIGARDFEIFIQFLIEVCMMCLVGYMMGLIMSCVMIGILCWYLDSVFYLSISLCFMLCLLCLMIGVVAGVFPAYIACKKEVVDVLNL